MMDPTVCFLVGDTHTRHCGVKDYTLRLAKALTECNVAAEVMAPDSWETKDVMPFMKMLRKRRFDILHLQYPSIGHRGSLWPHFIGRMNLGSKFVVTLHEYTHLFRRHQLSTKLFPWTAKQLLFTTGTEMDKYGGARVPQQAVFIGSNVPAFSGIAKKTLNVIHFGQIRANKGIEEFLALAQRSQQSGLPFTFQVIGSVAERQAAYFKQLRSSSAAIVEWTFDPSCDEVAFIMAASFAAYLPFPDGATYRRGSLLATLTNGLPTLTRVGRDTPPELIPVVLPTAGAEDALAHLKRLLESPDEARQLGSSARLFSQRFSWTRIAQVHKQVYRDVLQSGSRVAQPIVADTNSAMSGQG